MNLDLSNYKALVCGSTQGIGFAAAQELALLGANVVLMARNEAALKEAIAKLSTDNTQQHQYIIADFNNPSNVEQQVRDFIVKNGTIHIVVNNTGGPAGGPITNATVEAFTQTFSQHLLCNHLIRTQTT
jgi:3-oxoacyl-[acyl-carrier protein] reductase